MTRIAIAKAQTVLTVLAGWIAVAALVVLFVACSAGGPPSATKPPKETAVPNNLTQKQVTAGVEHYLNLIKSQLPQGSRLGPGQGTQLKAGFGTSECFTPDGNDLSGQILVDAQYFVEGIDPAGYSTLADMLRDIWRGLGYRIIDDIHYKDLDRTVRVATPADDYHLTVYTYGDNRSVPLVVVESPCAWPDRAPSSTSRPS